MTFGPGDIVQFHRIIGSYTVISAEVFGGRIGSPQQGPAYERVMIQRIRPSGTIIRISTDAEALRLVWKADEYADWLRQEEERDDD